MHWIIEGARKVIAAKFNIKTPQVVLDAINNYKEQNDWLQHFIDERCIVDKKLRESSQELYRKYLEYCSINNEYARSTTDFSTELERNGFKKLIEKRRRYIVGLRLKTTREMQVFDDFLD